MTITGFIIRNAFRNKRRLLLTVLSVSISLFLYIALMAVLSAFSSPEMNDNSADRLIVRHRVSLGNALPTRYYERIARLPEVAACSKFTWFGGIYKDEKNFFPQFAINPDQIFGILTEAKVPPEQMRDFLREKTACIVGKSTMKRFGWKIGEKVNLRGTFWGCDPELVIRGVYEGGIDESNMFWRHDYFEELMGNIGLCGTFWLKIKRGADMASTIDKIDAMFRNTDAETKTETERAFVMNFMSMQGNVKTLLGSIAGVIVFTMVLVTASTMSMSIRERSREIAVLKAIGFDAPRLFGLILAESTSLSLLGGAIGCSAGFALSQMDLTAATSGAVPKLLIPTEVLISGMVLALGLGVVSSLVPAYSTLRTTIVAGLKELD